MNIYTVRKLVFAGGHANKKPRDFKEHKEERADLPRSDSMGVYIQEASQICVQEGIPSVSFYYLYLFKCIVFPLKNQCFELIYFYNKNCF